MSVSYTCPDPHCGVTLKTPNRIAVGKSVKCPKCGHPFVPEPAGMSANDPRATAPAAGAAAAGGVARPFLDDEDSEESVKRGYGVVQDNAEEVKAAKKNRPKFTEVQDKFKKSARGPAQALLVMPSNLLLGAGMIICALSIVFFIVGMWPLVFNDAPPGEEELDEAVFGMLMGVLGFVWGGIVCYGASQMQELGSYIFAMLGAIMGLPLLVGIFALIMLMNPRVKAGFVEAESGPDELDDDDEDQEDEDEDEDDEGKPRRKKKESDGSRRAKKAAGVLGGMLLGAVLGDEEGGDDGGDDDYEDEPEEEEEEEEEDDPEEEDEEEDVDEAEDEEDDEENRRRKKKRR